MSIIRTFPLLPALLLITLILLPVSLWAVETVKSPVVEEGVLEFELKGKYQHDSVPSKNAEQEYDTNAAYAPTSWWKTKGEWTFEKKRALPFRYKAFKWENIFNLNGNDAAHEVVFGFYEDIALADRTDSSHAFTLGLLAARTFGKVSNLGNIYIKRDFGSTAKNGVAFQYRWQTKYALDPLFQPGFEIIGDTGRRDDFHEQALNIGPMFYGKLDGIGLAGFSYEAGYLLGATMGSRDGMLKWKLKYAVPLH